jgi:hypothetical protein
MNIEESFSNTSAADVANTTSDVKFFGNGDTFKLISKASSESQGWMKSCRAMEIEGEGCLVQVTTQLKNPDGSYAVAEALSFVPGVKIATLHDAFDIISGRKLVTI